MNEASVRRIAAYFLNFLIVIEYYYETEKKDRTQLGMYFSNHLGFIFSLGFSMI